MVLELVFWDVQHGSATYIKTPNGKHIVVDLGIGSYSANSGEKFSPLKHLNEKYNVEGLDHVIITHPDKDHIDDILNFKSMSPKVLSRPKTITKEEILEKLSDDESSNEIFKEYLRICESYCQPVETGNDLTVPDNAGKVEINIFRPSRDTSSKKINNHSLVTVLRYAGSTVILPGDNEVASWKELMEDKEFMDAVKNADILLAPHHGRDSGFYNELMKHINPYITVISDGEECDTSATDRYGAITRGWKVNSKSLGQIERKCLTTRKDGVIVIKLGYNDSRPFIDVRID
ncbi:ComEC/Rec2 family competence protein [Methanocella sp. MCL-LM]|uniref:ComEC/Rec2 family competence protein n=1 Tax=Methanocella sp. MCL-LM TaxID=3412035 RepID=UPI003C74D2DB